MKATELDEWFGYAVRQGFPGDGLRLAGPGKAPPREQSPEETFEILKKLAVKYPPRHKETD